MSQDGVKGSGEPNHLEGEGFSPIIELIPEGNGQIDLPKWHGKVLGLGGGMSG